MWLKPEERDLTFITYPLAKAERQYQQPETWNQQPVTISQFNHLSRLSLWNKSAI